MAQKRANTRIPPLESTRDTSQAHSHGSAHQRLPGGAGGRPCPGHESPARVLGMRPVAGANIAARAPTLAAARVGRRGAAKNPGQSPAGGQGRKWREVVPGRVTADS